MAVESLAALELDKHRVARRGGEEAEGKLWMAHVMSLSAVSRERFVG